MRLIDADALKESIAKQCDLCVLGGLEEIAEVMRKGFFQEIDNAPTVKQPEIIRCKECKHSRFFDPCLCCYEFGGEIIVPKNGFCFMAERRTDRQTD